MENKTITLELTIAETQAILNVLGELPTKSNAWPLAAKIDAILSAAQAEAPSNEQAEAA